MATQANILDFGMDTISMAGTLPDKLRAMREAGFSQVMLSARDLMQHAEGYEAAVRAVRESGLRITGFDTLTVIDADNYSLANVTLRRAHWAAAVGYVDMSFQGWSVVSGRPSVNSRATITAPNSSIAVVVTSSSAGSVVYAVTATVNGAVVSYTVTASYPVSGAPTYTVVATPT